MLERSVELVLVLLVHRSAESPNDMIHERRVDRRIEYIGAVRLADVHNVVVRRCRRQSAQSARQIRNRARTTTEHVEELQQRNFVECNVRHIGFQVGLERVELAERERCDALKIARLRRRSCRPPRPAMSLTWRSDKLVPASHHTTPAPL
jgi:hypothetical protein